MQQDSSTTLDVGVEAQGWSIRASDIVFGLLVLVVMVLAWQKLGTKMDYYEQAILLGSGIAVVAFGCFWRPARQFMVVCGLLALGATQLYQGDLARAGQVFWLKYLLASQSAVMWMCVLFVLATLLYWLGLATRSATADLVGTGLTWSAAAAALVAKLVRWYESYLIGADVGHIPVSNLYEVFILFCLITALMYLYYEQKFATRRMGAFVLPIITAAVGFILWYSFDRRAHEIQPLIPALQSWWMKIHVPANFVGYGAFSLAAMLGVAQLLVSRGILASRLPSYDLLGEVMYRAIAVGFLFFTIATVLGAMWAADAWGGYWSWDPKETWALIVWLNYAVWLHLRLVKGWRGNVLAWWAVLGLLVTTFAFLGVNMFLSGLHSYGTL
ncbi:c-type cytochrome biogenesis protein CcsB [Parachitinimonas caeni]|uniref:C-type cytochrome biogenesis protein CcsB n=1 Tax=Parachitinimonas caeni TaxID=3031301 RepID=A0ABT7DR87_9NEIS|nr:c-type cytochrome biogenesis protein CcsB [Parachitinimonas caeni]MDK2122474.1 c-type cytochrome biogenesis protein CcsB [Parachitinimonas caeni]